MNKNIPAGYDENGVRSGNGDWEEGEEETRCFRCDKLLKEGQGIKVGNPGNQQVLCEVCASDMGVI